jgi:hypothetical protein
MRQERREKEGRKPAASARLEVDLSWLEEMRGVIAAEWPEVGEEIKGEGVTVDHEVTAEIGGQWPGKSGG